MTLKMFKGTTAILILSLLIAKGVDYIKSKDNSDKEINPIYERKIYRHQLKDNNIDYNSIEKNLKKYYSFNLENLV